MNHTTITSPLALQKESVDPHKLIRSIVHEMKPMIHSHGLSLNLVIEGENWFVPDEDLPNLFSEKNNHLFNAKQLVEQLGGTITAENEVGENTILFIILPVCRVLENEFLTTDFIIID